MKTFLKPTKQKGLLTLVLTVFYYISYFAGTQISGMITNLFVSSEAILAIIEPMMPELMSQMGLLMKMVIVLFAVQFIFVLLIAYVFACLIVHIVGRKKNVNNT